jgi:hypothetical protein
MPNAGIGAMQQATTGDARPAPRPMPRALAQPRPPHAAPSRRPARGAVLGPALGFACGAIFWQAVGFSSLLTAVLPDGTGDAASARHIETAANQLETGSLPTIYRVDAAACTSLELDRQSNRTVERPCPPEGLALRLNDGDNREDLANLAAEYGIR